MTVRFVLNDYVRQVGDQAIRLYASNKGNHGYRPTGLYIESAHWDKEKGRVKRSHPLHKQYNQKLQELAYEVQLELLSGKAVKSLGKPSIELTGYLDKFISQNTELTPGTMKHYQSLHNHLTVFLHDKQKSKLAFEDVTPVWAYEFTDSLITKGIGQSGIRNLFKKLKRIVREAYDNGLHSSQEWKAIRLPKEPSNIKVFLTKEEVERIRELDLSGALHLEQARDLFLIAYGLFMRYCDVVRINKSMVSMRDGQHYLTYCSSKTNIRATIPIGMKTKSLLEKYDYRTSLSSNQKVNAYLKRIANLAGINHMVSQGKGTAPKSEFVTFHTARRSRATNAQLEGIDLKTIAALGGWTNLQTLDRYLRASNQVMAVNAARHPFFLE